MIDTFKKYLESLDDAMAMDDDMDDADKDVEDIIL